MIFEQLLYEGTLKQENIFGPMTDRVGKNLVA